MSHKLLASKPELYHGRKNSRPYFEGWYFKNVSLNDDLIIAVICGVSRSNKKDDDHSFIQIILGPIYKSYYIKLPYEKFLYNNNFFEVQIGKNLFSAYQMHLDIDEADILLKADLNYFNHLHIARSFSMPSIMGPFSYLPNMQCNHEVISLKNTINGKIFLNNKFYDMNKAVGYIEKDWGCAFPQSWIWLQGNISKKTTCDTALMISIANIQYGIFNFKGLIAVITFEDEEFKFATYNNARIKSIKQNENGVELMLSRYQFKLKINAKTGGFEKLLAPTLGGMDRIIYESVSAEITYELKKSDNIICSGRLINCGMEISEIDKLF